MPEIPRCAVSTTRRPPIRPTRGSRSRRYERNTPEVADETIPAEILDPEGVAESKDPELVMERTTSTLRKLWDDWMCRRGGGDYSDVAFFGKRIGGVPVPAADAYRALEQALRSPGYAPRSRWT